MVIIIILNMYASIHKVGRRNKGKVGIGAVLNQKKSPSRSSGAVVGGAAVDERARDPALSERKRAADSTRPIEPN